MKTNTLKMIVAPFVLCLSFITQSNATPPLAPDLSPPENKPNPQQLNLSHGSTINLEANKKLVEAFYSAVFSKHQVMSASDRYLSDDYIQHNPQLPNGKKPFIDFFSDYFKRFPQAQNEIKHMFADGDFVILHVLSKQYPKDRGTAIVDIFRVQDGKIVEHWDVIQAIPQSAKNTNTMF